MSGIGFWELIFLFLIGLIVLGPERLPRVANQLGSWLGQARRMTRVLRRQLEDELNLEQEQNIRPPMKAVTAQPASDVDESWPPAHGPDEPGTGVGDEEGGAEADPGEVPESEKARNDSEAATGGADEPGPASPDKQQQ